jgi:hypothetical protein
MSRGGLTIPAKAGIVVHPYPGRPHDILFLV